MIYCVFVVKGKKFNVRNFLKQSRWKVANFWVKGEKIPGKDLKTDDDGLTYSIGEIKLFSKKKAMELEKKMIVFLKKNKNQIGNLRKMGVDNIYFDIGIFKKIFTGNLAEFTIEFEKKLIGLLYELGIAINISYYNF